MNKITKNLSVSQGASKSGGRHYGLDWGTYQATSGYKAMPMKPNPTPSDKKQNMDYQKKIGVFGEKVANHAKIDVKAGSFTR